MAVAPDGFESRTDAYVFVNLLGNCALLEKSFNISKSDRPMWEFLKEVHEFKNGSVERGQWEDAMALSPVLTSPDEQSLEAIKGAIQSRDSTIRKDLVEFLSGTKVRAG